MITPSAQTGDRELSEPGALPLPPGPLGFPSSVSSRSSTAIACLWDGRLALARGQAWQ